MAKMFFSVFVSRMHRKVLFKKNWFRHIFATKLSFKVPAPATPNKDDRELLSLGPEQAVTSLQESSTLPASLFQCFIVFPYKLDRFSDYLRQKNDWFCMEKQWNTEMKSRRSLKWRHGLFLAQTLQLPVIFVGRGRRGYFKARF